MPGPVRRAILAKVSSHLVHGMGEGLVDDCTVEVIALPRGGSARAVVRCLYAPRIAHVHPVSLRPFGG